MYSMHNVGKSAARKNNRKTLRHVIEALEERRLLTATIVGSSTVYPTIQSAINAAPAGATINVTAGTYDEALTINKTLALDGAEANVDARNARGAESIIYATPTAIDITANDVTINGFTVEGDEQNIGDGLGAGIVMGPMIQGTQVINNIIQNNVTGIYLSNDSNTDQALIQHNLIQNNYENGQVWTAGWNGSRAIYSDGTVTGGLLTNALINANTIVNNQSGYDESEGLIALEALNPGKQFNVTISNNTLGNDSKSILMINVTNITYIGNTVTGFSDGSSGPVRFEGDANNVDIQYNTIDNNYGPGIGSDDSGAPGDNSGFVVDNNNIYNQYSGIGLLTIANTYDGTVYAQNDYWGSASGPSGDGPGTGLAVWANGTSGHYMTPTGAAGGSIVFSPWATTMINIANIPAPAAPSNLSLSGISSSQVTLNWSAPSSTAINQLLERSTDGVNWTTIATLPPLLNTYTDTTFNSSTNFYYRVVASNFTGQSPASNVASYSAPTAPGAPALAAAALSASQIQLYWTPADAAATSFTLQRSTDDINFTTIATGIVANSDSYLDSGQATNTQYYYRLYAVNTVGSSPASAIVPVATLVGNPTAVPISSIPWTSATAGWGSVQLNQSIKGNPITVHGVVYSSGLGAHASSTITYNLAGKYNTFVSDVGLDDEEIGVGSGAVDFQVIGDGNVLVDTGVLTPSSPTIHLVVNVTGVKTLVLQVNPGITGDIDYDHADWAGAELLIDPPVPTAPTAPANFSAVAVGQNSINLSWTATSSNQTSFTILRSIDGVNFSAIATGVAANATTYTDSSSLATGTEYYYEVEAVNSVGASGRSNIANATTAAVSLVTTPLSSIPWTSATAGWGSVQLNQSIKDNPITIHGVVYSTGIGTHASSTITYNLAGQYTTFVSDVGLDDEEIGVGSGAVDFQVIGDGKVLFDSGVLTPSSSTVHIAVSVVGVQTLTLQVNPGIAGDIDYDHADWAGAELLSTPAAPIAPTNLVATPMGSTSVKLTWAASPGATSYQIDRSTDGVNWTTVATNLSNSLTGWIDTAGIAASTEYYFRIRAVNSVGTSANSNVANATTNALTTVTYLSSLPWTTATVGWGTIQQNASIKGNPITIHGVVYASGIGTHAASSITYSLGGAYTSFLSDVGLDDEEIGVGSGAVDFQVIGTTNGVQTVLFDSGVLTPSSPTVSINVSVVGVQTLTLVVNPGIVGTIDYDHADWADARLTV
jgi:hypothetical protein